MAVFLSKCAESLNSSEEVSDLDEHFIDARDRFVAGGLNALRRHPGAGHWLQYGLTFSNEKLQRLYKHLYVMVNQLVKENSIGNFFYMHKPPGLRIRFYLTQPNNDQQQVIERMLRNWVDQKIIEGFRPGVYEAEAHLFGGEESMNYVHSLFTIDSLTLLNYQLIPQNRKRRTPDWLLSLVMLHDLFSELGISGWEHIDVWERIREKMFRTIPPSLFETPDFQELVKEIHHKWKNRQQLFQELSPALKKIAGDFKTKIAPVVAVWRSHYFETSRAYIGVREAAAFFTIFHWNRAGISFPRQSIITEALAARDNLTI
jgi:thiopeptide-type bacteriocin biosynthesis protein